MVTMGCFPGAILVVVHYLPLHITGSREGGRLFEYQLEPSSGIRLDGHVAPDDVIVAFGAQCCHRCIPHKVKWKLAICSHG